MYIIQIIIKKKVEVVNRQTFHCEILFRNESVKVGFLHQVS